MKALDRESVERFKRDVARVRPLAAGERMAVAVSGGPDSMALLALAAAAFPGQVTAATVDHRLRPEAADEAQMVATWCAANAIPHTTLIVQEEIGVGSIQAEARARRYALLLEWAAASGAACLATAHHADDQAETFLMRAARGSGVAGLGAIRALRQDGGIAVIRPLLTWRVAELRALATRQNLPFVDDPSNADPHYDRTRFRALLRGAPWLDPVQIGRAATHAAEADAAIREIEAWLWKTRSNLSQDRHPGPVPGATSARDLQVEDAEHRECRDEPGMMGEGPLVCIDMTDLPREMRRRLARKAIHTVRAAHAIARPTFDDSTNIEPLLDSLESGKTATQAGILVRVRANVWCFSPQPPRRSL